MPTYLAHLWVAFARVKNQRVRLRPRLGRERAEPGMVRRIGYPAALTRGGSLEITVLSFGDIVGQPGRRLLQERLPALRKHFGAHLVIANAENIANGSGLTPELVQKIRSAGVDVVTSGDHVYRRKEILPILAKDDRVLRPANFPLGAVGRGFTSVSVAGVTVGVVNVQGRVFMDPIDCPFRAADDAIARLKGCDAIVVDVHAEATSEKIAMGRHLDGRAALVFGTHTHVQTADEQILAGGTAYITDLGMTGPHDGVIGRRSEQVLKRFLTGMPYPFEVGDQEVRMSGIVCRFDLARRRAVAIRRISLGATDPLPDAGLPGVPAGDAGL